MATKNKTTETGVPVSDFIHSFVNSEQKKQDSFELIRLMQEWSGFAPRMWGPTIIGFGSYHYRYASGHEGDAPMIGFSPRKADLTLYVFSPKDDNLHLLEGLGRYRVSKACIYIKRLSDISIPVLKKLCEYSIRYLQEHHVCACRDDT